MSIFFKEKKPAPPVITVRPFTNGIPVAPDLKRLHDKFGVPKIDSLIPYEEVARVLQVNKHSSRFKTVTAAWRKKMESVHHVLLVAEINRGYRALAPRERIVAAKSKHDSGCKKIAQAGQIALNTQPKGLSEELLRARDHLIRTGAAFKQRALVAYKRPKELS